MIAVLPRLAVDEGRQRRAVTQVGDEGAAEVTALLLGDLGEAGQRLAVVRPGTERCRRARRRRAGRGPRASAARDAAEAVGLDAEGAPAMRRGGDAGGPDRQPDRDAFARHLNLLRGDVLDHAAEAHHDAEAAQPLERVLREVRGEARQDAAAAPRSAARACFRGGCCGSRRAEPCSGMSSAIEPAELRRRSGPPPMTRDRHQPRTLPQGRRRARPARRSGAGGTGSRGRPRSS